MTLTAADPTGSTGGSTGGSNNPIDADADDRS
eukprot:CAMPEP_0174974886 /NCGR_PEP_ID=MMETSP0004_2-20121128/12117_1 /TAXON_ID=420556 /ORGANISM="Ochromonas sp., Strain CCMP1393" /LENGTH=31 /DNA_ID= /DNA_START= /DNA_END= /DNA_ORIENTATION=